MNRLLIAGNFGSFRHKAAHDRISVCLAVNGDHEEGSGSFPCFKEVVLRAILFRKECDTVFCPVVRLFFSPRKVIVIGLFIKSQSNCYRFLIICHKSITQQKTLV